MILLENYKRQQVQWRCKRIHACVISRLFVPAAWWPEELQLKQATCFICQTTASLIVQVFANHCETIGLTLNQTPMGCEAVVIQLRPNIATAHRFSFHRPPFHLVFDILHTHIKNFTWKKKEWFTHQGLIFRYTVYSHFVRVVTYQVCLVSWHFCTLKGYWPHDGSWTKIWMYTPRC